MSTEPWPRFTHAERRTMLLPRRRILYVPMPKSGCTSMLWTLSQVAGCAPEQFHRSVSGQVTPSMTIHDLDRWRDKYKWAELTGSEQADIAADPEWLRFTTVRNPATRLWSAWQSKLLLREPDYAAAYGTERWFPRRPDDALELVDAFRTFVHALNVEPDVRPSDAHWAPQTRVLDTAPPLTHIGRIENIDETVDLLRLHIGGRAASRVRVARENGGLLPYSPALYDAETAQIVNDVFAEDLDRFGYPPLEPDPEASLDDWTAAVEPMLPLLRGHIDRHERLAVLLRVARRRTRSASAPEYRASTENPIPTGSDDPNDEGALSTHAVHQRV
ncbi:MAG: sulfotransferase family 2 domain-containing protein [Nocardioidaceae bacterium]